MSFFAGAAMVGGNLDRKIQGQLSKVFQALDSEVNLLVKEKNIPPKQIRSLRPLNYCAIVTMNAIHIVATCKNTGGLAETKYFNAPGETGNLQSIIKFVEDKFFYEEAFGLSLPRNILEISTEEQNRIVKDVAKTYFENEIAHNDKINNMVKINPIFNGREFIINKDLIFMLSPFAEPFDTIFIDHIKPTVEKIKNFNCLRADNIYDNKPIIEDIWKHINEASIIIAELTGRNPNVFYEVGIAHTIGKEVILLTQDINDIPFDLRHLRCIVYEYTPKGISSLEANLTNTINNINARIK